VFSDSGPKGAVVCSLARMCEPHEFSVNSVFVGQERGALGIPHIRSRTDVSQVCTYHGVQLSSSRLLTWAYFVRFSPDSDIPIDRGLPIGRLVPRCDIAHMIAIYSCRRLILQPRVRESLADRRIVRVQPCTQPLNAAVLAAGPDVIR
jgi:hypothetical protein